MLFDFLILWWHWIVLGLVLLIIEVNTGTFLFAGFAVAALFTGLIDLALKTGFTTELVLWSIFSVIAFVVWKRYFKKEPYQSIGQSDSAVGKKGKVTEAISPQKRGKVRFEVPLHGNSEWVATADSVIEPGEEVVVVEVLGQMIKVKKA